MNVRVLSVLLLAACSPSIIDFGPQPEPAVHGEPQNPDAPWAGCGVEERLYFHEDDFYNEDLVGDQPDILWRRDHTTYEPDGIRFVHRVYDEAGALTADLQYTGAGWLRGLCSNNALDRLEFGLDRRTVYCAPGSGWSYAYQGDAGLVEEQADWSDAASLGGVYKRGFVTTRRADGRLESELQDNDGDQAFDAGIVWAWQQEGDRWFGEGRDFLGEDEPLGDVVVDIVQHVVDGRLVRETRTEVDSSGHGRVRTLEAGWNGAQPTWRRVEDVWRTRVWETRVVTASTYERGLLVEETITHTDTTSQAGTRVDTKLLQQDWDGTDLVRRSRGWSSDEHDFRWSEERVFVHHDGYDANVGEPPYDVPQPTVDLEQVSTGYVVEHVGPHGETLAELSYVGDDGRAHTSWIERRDSYGRKVGGLLLADENGEVGWFEYTTVDATCP